MKHNDNLHKIDEINNVLLKYNKNSEDVQGTDLM